jgi:hypothetical protein
MKSISHAKDRDDWLSGHIPYRVHAGLAGLPLASEYLPATAEPALRARFAAICLNNAVYEGRLAAIRWLIDFIGIRDKKGKPARPRRVGEHDVGITSLPGGSEVHLDSPEAEILRKVWKGCSQASSHATHASNHFSVEPEILEQAMRIIISHLEKTIYSDSPMPSPSDSPTPHQ